MLWYKAWLESRSRFFLIAGVILLTFWYMAPEVLGRLSGARGAARFPGMWQYSLNSLWILWLAIAVMLAGAGINTQTARGVTHGPHGSMFFTLSLPVRRRRLMGIRVMVGALETVLLLLSTCLLIWLVSPLLRSRIGLGSVLLYAFVSLVGSSVAYSFSALLATFLDEMWQFNGCFLAIGAIISLRVSVSQFMSYDIFRALGDLSYLTTGMLPWRGILTCLALSSALLFAAAQIVERKQY
jgi:hypothetical protein